MNNIHPDFPANMADGRVYANWEPTAVINEQLRKRENIQTNWEYRAYLQKNANTIREFNQTEACLQSGCSYTYVKQPVFHETDMKQTYLTRQQLQKKMYPTLSG
jgi:hypothetical protein